MARILKGNLHRSRTADDLLVKLRIKLQADIVIISEQYKNKDEPNWTADSLGTAAIWIPDTRTVPIKSQGKERGFLWMKCVAAISRQTKV